MKKRLLIFTLLALVFMCTKNVYAFDSSNYKNRGLCGNFEVASFDSNGSINKVACYGSYNEAKTFIEEQKRKGNYEVTKYSTERKEKKAKGEVVDAWYRVTLVKDFNDEKEPLVSYDEEEDE